MISGIHVFISKLGNLGDRDCESLAMISKERITACYMGLIRLKLEREHYQGEANGIKCNCTLALTCLLCARLSTCPLYEYKSVVLSTTCLFHPATNRLVVC